MTAGDTPSPATAAALPLSDTPRPGREPLLGDLPFRAHLVLLIAAWVMLFQFWGNSTFGYTATASLFSWVRSVYDSNSDDSVGYVVLPLIAALLYLRRERWVHLPAAPWLPALGLLLVAITMHAAGYLIQQTRVSLFAFGLGLYALTGLLWGRRWMTTAAYPFLLLVFAIPLTAYTDSLTFPLRLASTQLATGLCNTLLNLDLVREGTTVYKLGPHGVRGFEFEVAPACSGIRSLTVVFMMASAFGYLQYTTTWRRLVLILAALPLALLGNLVRLCVVFLISDVFGADAGKRIESNLGFITFLFAFAAILALQRYLKEPSGDAATPSPDPAAASENPGSLRE